MIFAANLKAIRALFFINLSLLALLPFTGIVQLHWEGTLWSIVLYFVFGACGIVATYHRYYAHRTFTFKHEWVKRLFTVFGALTGSGSALGWAAMHRIHHKHPDTTDDPHSPVHGVWNTLTVKYSYGEGKWRYIRDLLKEPIVVLTHRWYFAILIWYCSVLLLLFGVPGVFYGFCLPSVITLGMSGITNYVSHIPWLGYQRHKDAGQATNAWWTSVFNCGEGWHNNHHHNPGSFTTKEKWWEWDMAGSIISMVKQ